MKTRTRCKCRRMCPLALGTSIAKVDSVYLHSHEILSELPACPIRVKTSGVSWHSCEISESRPLNHFQAEEWERERDAVQTTTQYDFPNPNKKQPYHDRKKWLQLRLLLLSMMLVFLFLSSLLWSLLCLLHDVEVHIASGSSPPHRLPTRFHTVVNEAIRGHRVLETCVAMSVHVCPMPFWCVLKAYIFSAHAHPVHPTFIRCTQGMARSVCAPSASHID